jgi:hypothetical protein
MNIKFEKLLNRHFLSLSLLLLIFAVSTVQTAEAQNRPTNTELGVILGEPTGISFKLWQSGSTAFGGAVAWSLGRNETVHIHLDYLFHSDLDVDQGVLMFYYGPGVRTLFSDNNPRVGVRFPVGLQYNVDSTRLSLFFEVAPTLDLIPATTFGVNGGLGFRFFL